MTLPSWVRRTVKDIVRIVAADTCVICGTPLSEGEDKLCFECQTKLARTHLHEQKGNTFEQRFYGRTRIEMASTFLFFEKGNRTQTLLHALKYKEEYHLGVMLGRQFGAEMKGGRWDDIDFLVPVPLHPKKFKIRGYNQAEAIARGIGQTLGKPVIEDVLVRTVANETQTKRTVEERQKNVKGIFAAQNLHKVEGKHIAIVDDVLTTGATLDACAQAFHGCDVRISILALASAEK